jgi:acyl dehydratase
MPLNVDALMNWPVVETAHTYKAEDTILYALGVGVGAQPADERELRFVFENRLVALPTMAVILGAKFPWLRAPETGVNMKKMLHGETTLTMHAALPTEGEVVSRTSILGVVDRGEGKAASVYFRHEVQERKSSNLLATVGGCFVMRDGGGGGSTDFVPPLPQPIPERAPDRVIDTPTLPQAGLLYRLTGDRNPLHIDPALAKAVGFDRPILHGSCTYGTAGRALLMDVCEGDPSRLHRLDVRFTAPLYPGETIRTEVWNLEADKQAFRCVALERNVAVLNNGYLETQQPAS